MSPRGLNGLCHNSTIFTEKRTHRRGAWFTLPLLLLFAAGCATVSGSRVDGSLHSEEGLASWYGNEYHGRQTASGETFNQNAMTAAHRTWPFGTVAHVRNQTNGRTVTVRINDRGPFIRGRIIDLSRGAAQEIDMVRDGVVPVRADVLRWGADEPPPPSRRGVLDYILPWRWFG